MQIDRIPGGAWPLTGVVTGLAGLAASYAAAAVLTVRESPVVAVSELVITLTPGAAVEVAIDLFGSANKAVLTAGVSLLLGALFALAGWLGRRHWWRSSFVWLPLAAVGLVAVLSGPDPAPAAVLPVGVGLVTWLVVGTALTEPLRRLGVRTAPVGGEGSARSPGSPGAAGPSTRRAFLVRTAAVAAGAAVVAGTGRLVGRGRRQIERTRSLLKLPISRPAVPDGVDLDLAGLPAWRTPNSSFYVIHTAVRVPTVDPDSWRLRIHGMVEREITLTYQDLLEREMTESWVTLSCVSNEIGGDLVGNAWWSGVRVADLLAEAGVSPEADAVAQTSQDGWTCGTPLAALMDDRDALLAVGMNGRPLPIEHGFPVRTLVPGLYGFVSATKWLVDLEVTRFADFEAYWTGKGWAEQAPMKMASRIDVPGAGDEVAAGALRVGGVAWAPQRGIGRVQVALDGGPWREAELGSVPGADTWVQWVASVDVRPGEHALRVRATDGDGMVQTGSRLAPIPDGATGWHSVDFTATD